MCHFKDIRYQYHYNSDGKVRQIVAYDSDNNIIGLNIFEYDSHGNVKNGYVETTPSGAHGYNYYTGDNPGLINDFKLDIEDIHAAI